ncbi:MAG: NAD-dependent protein deacylase [Acidobacteria bacterium]|nr:NAD-dependent protein deacylase [Acidobacteriota bacterium]NIM60485.1 NAD-dependent protein deacylase [Acidobacteriota bacterium]NIO60382.1 NAD-dependent protein deacylase [Acidobacteriota bacterium]NIQ31454.1 NAD-dependent protein deacylase [Acidobacteriota bacterium]NIQ86698.1 NAD-dependent protein deacylase [Acidobacteriota bacterium]
MTGAGVSAESGLATFRGEGGLWEGRDPVELATPEAFRRDPKTVWRFYTERREKAAQASPNAGHRALAALEEALGERFLLVTQNVDGLHERAGNRRIVRLHGSLWRLRCTRCGDEDEDLDLTASHRCRCGGRRRPGVVWFGEPLPEGAYEQAAEAAARADIVLVAGTSSIVYPAAGLPEIGREAGAWTVEINPERTAISDRVDERVPAASGSALPALVEASSLGAD